MTTVTLLIFSGRRDPTWELPAGEVSALAKRLEGVRSAPDLSILGYRGFLIHSDDPALPREILIRENPDLERFLLQTGASHLDSHIHAIARDAIG